MLPFPAALERLLSHIPAQPAERCRLEEAAGRVLRAEVRTDRAVPPFDRVMMDGHALRLADWRAGHRRFRVTGVAPAGHPTVTLESAPGSCVEVMTGAPLPIGADVIVPVEESILNESNEVTLRDTTDLAAGRFIHRCGSDAAAGALVLSPGVVLGSREIGAAAACGAGWLEVSRRPRLAVLATGDELVPVDAQPLPHQIRQSNAHALTAALQRAGFSPAHTATLGDDPAGSARTLADRLATSDVLVLTGAVSKGARDFVPAMLTGLGCTCLFHGVAQRPGKPAGCWLGPAGQVVIALPGNPVSALTGLHAFVLPALAVAVGRPPAPARRVLPDERVDGLRGLTLHLPVTLREGRVNPAPTGNSGDFIGLLASDGFVTVPPREEAPAAAAALPFTPWL
jgi:molybdopterin molybdotransferase